MGAPKGAGRWECGEGAWAQEKAPTQRPHAHDVRDTHARCRTTHQHLNSALQPSEAYRRDRTEEGKAGKVQSCHTLGQGPPASHNRPGLLCRVP